jgi:uncharacterized protein YicC (UPF0701 family)
LLKTLEEPPRGTVIVLITSAPDKLLPTIRSRCAKAQFRPLPEEVIVERLSKLSKLDAEAARSAAQLSGGSLKRALNFDAANLARRTELIERFEALDRNDARGWLAMAETIADDRGRLETALDMLAKSGKTTAQIPEERLLGEVALQSDKADIDEELTRLHTHIGEFARLMAKDEQPGRKLDFLCQEMHREVNTMSNKLVQTEAAQHTIEMKQTVERLRQQVQNIE